MLVATWITVAATCPTQTLKTQFFTPSDEPLTTASAVAQGWTKALNFQAVVGAPGLSNGNCVSGMGYPYTWNNTLSREHPVTVYFTSFGNISGWSLDDFDGLLEANMVSSGVWMHVESKQYRISYSFRSDPCNHQGDVTNPVYDQIVINPSSLVEGSQVSTFNERIPASAAAANAAGWTAGGCMDFMGTHYTKSICSTTPYTAPNKYGLNCFVPVQPIYSPSSGCDTELTGMLLYQFTGSQSSKHDSDGASTPYEKAASNMKDMCGAGQQWVGKEISLVHTWFRSDAGAPGPVVCPANVQCWGIANFGFPFHMGCTPNGTSCVGAEPVCKTDHASNGGPFDWVDGGPDVGTIPFDSSLYAFNASVTVSYSDEVNTCATAALVKERYGPCCPASPAYDRCSMIAIGRNNFTCETVYNNFKDRSDCSDDVLFDDCPLCQSVKLTGC